MMRRGFKCMLCLSASLALAGGLFAVTQDNNAAEDDLSRYTAILDRNVFDLHAPPPPVVKDTTPPTPPPNIKFAGILNLLGKRQALFMVQQAAVPGKPPGKEEPLYLVEGQREGEFTLLEIHENDGTVKVDNNGATMVMNLDAVKLPSTPVAPAPGALPNRPGGFIPPVPGAQPRPTLGYAPTGAATPLGSPSSPANGADAGLNSIPSRTLRTSPVAVVPQDNASIEEKVILLEANRAASQGAQGMPPLPPPPMGLGGADGSANNTGGGLPALPAPTIPKWPTGYKPTTVPLPQLPR